MCIFFYMQNVKETDRYFITNRYYTPPSSSSTREIDENARREIVFRLKRIGPCHAVNIRDTGNYFVLPVFPPSPEIRCS